VPVTFRDRLLDTLRAIQPVLDVEGVLVVGSEVPNLLQHEAQSTLVVSEDVDVGVPVACHAEVKRRLQQIRALRPSEAEPSVWVPRDPHLIEVNFVGIDPAASLSEPAYVLEDDSFPLLVFAYLSFLLPARVIEVDGVRVPLPRPAGLMLEKLVTERTGDKGDRDLLVVLGLLMTASEADIDELVGEVGALPGELRQSVLSNLTVLSLMSPHRDMPDPLAHRRLVAELIDRVERSGGDG
jgi:hypothetical protein